MRSSNSAGHLKEALRAASATTIVAALVVALNAGCGSSGLGKQADEKVRQGASLATGLAEDALRANPTLRGQALVDAVKSAVAPAGGSISDAEATDIGAKLHIEFQGAASNGGGWFSSKANRVLCVDMLVAPEADPSTSLADADCKETIPAGYRTTTLN